MEAVLFRVAILLAIFASIFIFSQFLLGSLWRNRSRVAAINQRLRMIRQGTAREEVIARLRKHAPSHYPNLPPLLAGWVRAFQRMLLAATVPTTLPQMLMLMSGLFIVLLMVLVLFARSMQFALSGGIVLLLFVLASSVAFGLPMMFISLRAQRRRKRIEEQFPISLDIFVRALRSGHPIASALDLLTQEMDDPIGSEFGLVSDEVSYGAELTDALEAMADRWDLEDMRMFVVSLSVQSETGGNLAEILENLSKVIRARASMFMKVRALSSEGRMTAWMLSVLPVFALVSMFMVNPGFYLDVAGDPMFVFGFAGLILLYLIGVFTIRRMIDLKV
jgi:tight adherence protein B